MASNVQSNLAELNLFGLVERLVPLFRTKPKIKYDIYVKEWLEGGEGVKFSAKKVKSTLLPFHPRFIENVIEYSFMEEILFIRNWESTT